MKIKRLLKISLIAPLLLILLVTAYDTLTFLFRKNLYPELLGHRASNLQELNEYWISKGKPANFNLEKYGSYAPPHNYFVYTNTITVTGAVYHAIVSHTNYVLGIWTSHKTISVTGAVYHCSFGVRAPGFPPGILAITDEGLVVWIRERDGKAILSPEIDGIEP